MALGLDLAVQEHDSPARRRARQKLRGVEGFGEEIVGAGVERFEQLVGAAQRREQDDVGVGLVAYRADSRAELDAGQVGHHPVGDDHLRAGADEKFERFFARPRGQDGVLIGGQRLGDKFARDGGIVGDEDRQRRSSFVQRLLISLRCGEMWARRSVKWPKPGVKSVIAVYRIGARTSNPDFLRVS